MTQVVRWRILKYLALVSGILGCLLRSILYSSALDEKGLLIPGCWAETGLWILTALTAGLLFLLCSKSPPQDDHQNSYPPSGVSAAGAILAGVAFAICGLSNPVGGNLGMAEVVLRFSGAAALACVGFCRFTGHKPFFLFHCIVCVYLALRMICQYRIWSADPQLLNYCFYLGAYVALMLFAYQLAAWDVGLADHRKLWACGLAAVYLCTVSLADSTESFFLLSCGIWALTNLSRPTADTQTVHPSNSNQEESL